MNRIVIDSIAACNEFLRRNTSLSNGKNFRISHLRPAYATSRLCHENILGIYLAKPQATWMSVWLAVTSRTHLRKRQVNYFRPDTSSGDFIGRAGIYNPQKCPPEYVFCKSTYLYLFDDRVIRELPRVDLSRTESASGKEAALMQSGFRKEAISGSEEGLSTFTPSFTAEGVVDVDEWQVAIVNVQELSPDVEIEVEEKAIGELRDRVSWLDSDIGTNYIQPTVRVPQ